VTITHSIAWAWEEVKEEERILQFSSNIPTEYQKYTDFHREIAKVTEKDDTWIDNILPWIIK